ncbi:MAG: DUF4038 domain-containing protein [Pseudomonadota bacterium]
MAKVLDWGVRGALCMGFLSISALADVSPEAKNPAPHTMTSPENAFAFRYTGNNTSAILWLADTYWFCPSELCPIDASSNPAIDSMFRYLVDLRSSQGFNALQLAFLGPTPFEGKSVLDLYAEPTPHPDSARYWDHVRRYVAYANEKGMTVAIGVGFHTDLDRYDIDMLQRLWGDLIQALNPYDVVWFVAGEYNLNAPPERLKKISALVDFIRARDSRKRPLSLHPADHRRKASVIEPMAMLDFIMVQSGHSGATSPASIYQSIAKPGQPARPVIEAECLYEGIYGRVSANDVRRCMIRAVMSGAVGYSYGSHGLWYPVQSVADTRFSAGYGKAPPWWVAAQRPGAPLVGKLRHFFEALDWSALPARPHALLYVEHGPVESTPLVRMDEGHRALVWFPNDRPAQGKVLLQGLAKDERYCPQWISGDLSERAVDNAMIVEDRFTPLPPPPGLGDWFLILNKDTGDQCGDIVDRHTVTTPIAPGTPD